MGRQIGIDETDDMIETMQAGDGNPGSANTPIAVATPGTLTYADVVALYQQFPIGYQMRQVITNDAELKNVLTMAEFKDPMAGFDFVRTGVPARAARRHLAPLDQHRQRHLRHQPPAGRR